MSTSFERRRPSMEEEVVEIDEPEYNQLDLEEIGDKAKEKAMWGVFWSAIFFIIVIFLALWLFSVYRRWRREQALGQAKFAMQSFVGNAIQEFKPQQVFPGGPAAVMSAPALSGSSVVTPNDGSMMSPPVQHQLMMNPNNPMVPMNQMPQMGQMTAPNSPMMSDGDGAMSPQDMPNPYEVHRCFLWFNSTKDRDTKKLYRQFCRLRDYYTKNHKFLKSGHAPVTFHKYDLNREQCKAFFDQLAMYNGAAAQDAMHDGAVPMITFGRRHEQGENIVGKSGASSSDMQKKIDNIMNTQNTNAM